MRRLLPIFFLFSALCSCTKPFVQDIFIPVEESSGGLYEYTFEMSDTLGAYDFSFYTLIDGNWSDSVEMGVCWLAPSGETFNENVFLRPDERNRTVQLYRSAVVPAESGDWTIRVMVSGIPEGFRGLGMTCSYNGTR